MSTALHVFTFLEPLRAVLTDPDVSEVMINQGGRRVFIERSGLLEELDGVRLPSGDVEAAIEQIGKEIGAHVTADGCPIVEARFDNGDRVAGVLASVSVDGAALTIRRFGRRFSLVDLVQIGTLTPIDVDAIRTAMHRRWNVLIAGGTGSGKTTLLTACLDEVPPTTRIVLLETTSEIRLAREAAERLSDRPNLVRLQAREAREARWHGGISVPAVTLGMLFRTALRHRPDLLVCGEVRGGDAYYLVQALNSGHMGSFSTIHATRGAALRRLEDCTAEAQIMAADRIPEAVRSAIQMVVQIDRVGVDRVVTEIHDTAT